MKIDVKKWLKTIENAKGKLKPFYDQAEEAVSAYGQEQDNKPATKADIPINWSNIKVLGSALYSRSPAPEVRKRNVENPDPAPKEVSKLLERAITYQIDVCDFDTHVKNDRDEYLTAGLGVLRVKYKAKYDAQGFKVPGLETVKPKHWHYKNFIWDISKDWDECMWVCYVHTMDMNSVKSKYSDSMKGAPADVIAKTGKQCLYEIWDKETRQVIIIMDGHDKPLQMRPDPLKLENFFDCPKPLMANCRTDKTIPKPDYYFVQSRIEYINKVQRRIDALTDAIKDVGIHDASFTEGFKKLAKARDNEYIPLANLIDKLQGNNLDNVIAKLPYEAAATVVVILEERKTEAIEEIYQITGLSDIVRGSSKASETATAQQIKGQWANVRLSDKQSAINEQLRGLMRIYAEIICEQFSDETLFSMTGIEVTPEMRQIMSNDLLRSYAIDVETDSTIAQDELEEKEARLEMVNTVMAIIGQIGPMQQQGLIQADMAKELLLTTVRSFKHARNLEDMIQGMDGTAQQLEQLNMQLQETQQNADMQIQDLSMQLQQAQGQLQQVNMQEQAREDAETQSDINKENAEADYKRAQTAKLNQDMALEARGAMIGQQGLMVSPDQMMEP